MGCGQSAPAAEALVAITDAQQGIPMATKEPNPVSEATAPTSSSAQQDATPSIAATFKPIITPREQIKQGAGLPGEVVIEQVQAFRAETPEPPKASRPGSLPPVKTAAAAGGKRGGDVDEVDRMLQLNSSSKSQLVLEPTTPQRSSATAVEAFSRDSGPSRSPPSTTEERGKGQDQDQATSSAAQEADPWASLQSQYRIEQKAAGQGGAKQAGARRGKGGGSDDEDDDVVLLDEGMASGRGGPLMASRGASKAVLPPVKLVAPGGQPRAGGWGQGELAAAGTLMLDDEDTLQNSSASRHVGQVQVQVSAHSEDEETMLEAGGAVGGRHADDLGMEDFEDVDALIEAEMAANGMNKDLASKLAKFEAMNDD